MDRGTVEGAEFSRQNTCTRNAHVMTLCMIMGQHMLWRACPTGTMMRPRGGLAPLCWTPLPQERFCVNATMSM